jgi:hypothetical protein
MKKIVELKKDDEGNNYLDLKDISDIFDIDKIDSYKIEEMEQGITLVFFDKEGSPLKTLSREPGAGDSDSESEVRKNGV